MSTLLDHIKSHKQDAVLWKSQYLIDTSEFHPQKYANAVFQVAAMLQCIPNVTLRETYLKTVSKTCRITPKLLKGEVEAAVSKAKQETVIELKDNVSWTFPKGVDAGDAYQRGYYILKDGMNTGYYFPSGQKEWSRQSNFIITPLMHISSKTDDKRMFEIDNGFEKNIIDMPSRAVISVDQFRVTMYELPGNNLWFGTQQHLMKLLDNIGRDFQICYELKKLGWQPEGFFAYSNGIVLDHDFIPVDERGIAVFDGKNYYSPSASTTYKNVRSDDDEYENDRYLFYQPSAVRFEDWCKVFCKVYTESNSGMIGIATVLMALNKDVVYGIDNNCPHVNAYGEKGSGKSKYAESLSNVFMNGLLPCNLFHSTDYAFANRLSRFRNVIVWMDEFNDSTIKEERFEAIKAAYEGVARERGKGGSKSKTEILKVFCVLLLTGQYMSTKDDNSALTRCVILPFKKRTGDTAFTEEEIKNYEMLKGYEQQGLSGILLELLRYRKEFEKEYVLSFPEQFSEMRTLVGQQTASYNERVLRNYCALVTCIHFYSKRLKLPFTVDAFRKIMVQEVVKLSTLIAESDSLAEFWNTVQYLLETGEIQEGNHFKIDTVLQVKTNEKMLNYAAGEKILYLRLTTLHALYLEACRRQGGKGINKSTLELYLSSSKGYIGKNSSTRFMDQHGVSQVTSCYIFEMKHVKASLERMKQEETQVESTIIGKLDGALEAVTMGGVAKLKFRVITNNPYEMAGMMVNDYKHYFCYDACLENRDLINSTHNLVLTGLLTEKKKEDKVYRTMEVKSVQLKADDEGQTDLPF